MANELEQLVLSKAQKWLDGDYDEAARLLESVLAADPKNFLAN